MWTAGAGTDSGTVRLEAAGAGFSRVDLELGGGSRITIRDRKSGRSGWIPRGSTQASGALASAAAPGGTGEAAHALPAGDAFWPAVWFFPALALSESGTPRATVAGGSTTFNGTGAERLSLALKLPQRSAKMTAEIARLSEADFVLDAKTHLPLALDFLRYPGGLTNRAGVRVEIRYGDWRPVSGVEVPYRIERWINGTRQLLITINSAQINPPLDAGDFQFGGAQ